MIVRALAVLLLLAAPAWALDQSPHCRIKAYNGNSISCGSGTLIDDDTVVTCSHLFDDGASRIAVEFPSGVTLQARIAQRDKAHDLCTLQLSQPTDIPCVPVAERGHRPQRITVCGYGSGSFRSASGPIVDSERTGDAQYQHLVANVAVRSGDSGGGVLDEHGNVTGVIWGCADGQVRFFGGEPLWRIVEQTQCYGGRCRPVLRPIAPSRPAYQPSPKPAPQGCECGPKWESIEAKLALIARLETRIAELEARPTYTSDQLAVIAYQAVADFSEQHPLDVPEVPTYEQIAAEMQRRLSHSAVITLLDGTVQPQTQPLDKPLLFNQRQKGVTQETDHGR